MKLRIIIFITSVAFFLTGCSLFRTPGQPLQQPLSQESLPPCLALYELQRGNNDESHHGINRDTFIDLFVVNVADLGMGEKEIVAVVHPSPVKRNYRDVVGFLFVAGQIETFVDLSADVCLTREQETDTQYVAHIFVVDTYATNEVVYELYKFSVIIEKSNGIVRVQR